MKPIVREAFVLGAVNPLKEDAYIGAQIHASMNGIKSLIGTPFLQLFSKEIITLAKSVEKSKVIKKMENISF